MEYKAASEAAKRLEQCDRIENATVVQVDTEPFDFYEGTAEFDPETGEEFHVEFSLPLENPSYLTQDVLSTLASLEGDVGVYVSSDNWCRVR